MTRTTICGITALLFCTIIALVLYLQPGSHQPDFAPGTTVRVFLPVEGSTEKVRYERYASDRVSRTVTDIEYVDGGSEQITYWGDNNLRRTSIKYFNNQVKSKATFDHQTGKYYTSHQVYRLDGTLERAGELLTDGRYQTSYYWSDGKTLSRQRLFNPNRVFLSEKLFREDGSILADVVQAQSNQREIVLYWPNGARQANYSTNLVNGARGVFYGEDGVTIVCEFYRSYWLAEELYLNSAGKVWQQRLTYSGNGSQTINLYAADGSLAAVQMWKLRPASNGKPAYKLLSSIALYRNSDKPYRIITATNGKLDGVNEAGQDATGQQIADPVLLVEPASSTIPEPGLTERGAPKLVYDYE
jgi:antitoxin component YwqK of YwqJK toxin-antitoxin module